MSGKRGASGHAADGASGGDIKQPWHCTMSRTDDAAVKFPEAVKLPAVLRVAADSRHPRLSDYTPAAHAYGDAYVHPALYGISVEDIRGITLHTPRQDQQQDPRPGQHNSIVEDICHLTVPASLTGWRFTLSGTPRTRERRGPHLGRSYAAG